jgi:PhoH-like ATPase
VTKLEKTFVLDTNVLLYDAHSILKFGKNNVFIPLIVIEELDRFKKGQDENGRNARAFSRIVDKLRAKGHLADGVELENGGKLFISVGKKLEKDYIANIDLRLNDNIILASALSLKKERDNVILVSKDINLRLKADVLGIPAEDYGEQQGTLEELYSGFRILEVSAAELREFEKEHFLQLDDVHLDGIHPNEYLIMVDINNENYRNFGRYSAPKGGVVPLIKRREGVWGIYPKNIEQKFAMDALLNQDIKLVTLVGKAGTGKTILAIAAGLEMAIGQEDYSRLLVSRPVMPMGNDVGFLPGDIDEKLAPWMQPIFDNMDFLFGKKKGELTSSYDDLINAGLLHVEPLTYIRGRSLPEQYLIVDEAQNLSPHEVKTIITRAGEGTKIVLTGDCEQIDSPYLDSVNNGLAYCVERLKTEGIIGHTTLLIGERSPLSEIASQLL